MNHLHLILLVCSVLASGCEIPASIQQLAALQQVIASDLGLAPAMVNVSTFSGTGGTELRVVFQNAELSVSDEALCQRVSEMVSATYPSLSSVDRITVGMASSTKVGPVNATSQRGICVMEPNVQAAPVSPPAGDSTVTTTS